eukprot:TRINITY_DN277_c0_g1_i1.p1 TRINITY_DN277_c0_g1~~TRINITY_DN277_c0_g1_i1.p1  ORF type:complete len:295 (-),score=27.00 TRINITY_DN277_c0_g1_i1:37-921(-)
MMRDAERSGAQGHYYKQTYVSKTIPGGDGRPEVERYTTSMARAIGGGNNVMERQQLYQNSATGLEKAGHERTLNGQGRKVVHERIRGSGEERFVDHYHNLEEGKGREFDSRWHSKANELGLKTNTVSRALPYGTDMNPSAPLKGGYVPSVMDNDRMSKRFRPEPLMPSDAYALPAPPVRHSEIREPIMALPAPEQQYHPEPRTHGAPKAAQVRPAQNVRLGGRGLRPRIGQLNFKILFNHSLFCLLYTSDAADDTPCVDLGGRRIIKKKKQQDQNVAAQDKKSPTQQRTASICI